MSPGRYRLALTAVITFALSPFAASAGYGFALDDANYIQGHLGVQGPFSLENIFLRDSWGRSQFDTIGHYRPIGTLTFWLDQRIGRGSPWAFHATNLVLYAGLLLALERLLSFWCRRELGPVSRLLAVLAFGVLAVHADVVPSIAGRAELLAALFSLAAVAVAVRDRALQYRDAFLAIGLVLLALLSKESSALMSLVVPVLATRAAAERRDERRGPFLALAVGCVGMLAAVAAFRVLRMPLMHIGPERAIEDPLVGEPFPERIFGTLDVLGMYLRHIATGSGLAPDYSFSEPPVLRDGVLGIAAGGASVVAWGVLVVTRWKRSPRAADALLALAATYLPVASLIGDRLLFSPTLWLVVALAIVLESSVRAPRARAALAAGVVTFALYQATRAHAYAATWRDDVTVNDAEVQVYPNVLRAQRNLAHALADSGEHERAAWHLAIAEAIYAHYPAPVPRDAIPYDWEREPLAAQLDHLLGVFGPREGCAATRRAAARLRSWDDPKGGEALDQWMTARRAKCASPL